MSNKKSFVSPAPLPMNSARTRLRSAAFTLVEMMVTAGVIALSGGAIYGAISTVATVSAKNVALNDSGNSLRRAMERLSTAVEEAVEITDVATFNGTTFTSQATGTWGNAVRIIRYLPGTYYIVEQNSLYTASNPPPSIPTPLKYLPVGTTTIYVAYNTAANTTTTLSGSERLLPLYPLRREVLTGGPALGTLGLGLGAGTLSSGRGSFTLDNALTLAPTSASDDSTATVKAYNAAYLIQESAFVVIPNAGGNSCNLYYLADTSQPASRLLLSTNLAATQPTDVYHASQPTGSSGCSFCLRTDANGNQVLQMLLPIASQQYANALVAHGQTQGAYNFSVTANLSRRSLQNY